ncbi:MAG: hypothetical protein NVS4B10_16620 [Myxococcales bacterium]
MRPLDLVPLFCALGLGAAPAARAQNRADAPGAPFLGDTVQMPRSTAMAGAHAAAATSNDAILVNPAGLAQRRRYHAELDGILDPQFPATGVVASIADSTSLSVASGLLFARFGAGREAGRASGYQVGAAYAYSVGSSVFVGGHTKYLHFDGPAGESHKLAQDIGLLVNRGSFAWALVGQNLSTSKIALFPPLATAAIAFGTDADYHLAIDYRADLADTNRVKHRLSGGYELLFEQVAALRTGFGYDLTQHLGWFSAGLGLLTEKGALQLAYQRRVIGGFDHQFEAGVTLYLE